MDRTIVITLRGRNDGFRLDEDAYDRLERYLNRAGVRLEHDPDRAEVLGDLEGSVGDRLAALVASGDRLITGREIEGILEEVGAVDAGEDANAGRTPAPPPAQGRRRLTRIRDGQQIAGVCTGLAAYADIRVDWVRTLFILGTLLTVGGLGLLYVALMFILPIEPAAPGFGAERPRVQRG
jgi:phage shock protein PspC (stress-responsive transcriptional regulator)